MSDLYQPATTSPWDEAAKQYLDELLQVRPPLNYDAIADRMVVRFHRIFTKNSCISRARRNNANKARADGPRKGRPSKLFGEKPAIRTKATWHPKLQPEHKHGNVTLAELNERTDCRWIAGEVPPGLYCGKPRTEESCYCAEHARAAYPAMGRR